MPEPKESEARPAPGQDFGRQIEVKEKRLIRARARPPANVWFGFGTFGLIGWSVVIPALVGVAGGIWIDRTWPSRFSWTLMLLLLGIILGSLNAWRWVSQERKNIEKDK